VFSTVDLRELCGYFMKVETTALHLHTVQGVALSYLEGDFS
jgi:hypothetical protein